MLSVKFLPKKTDRKSNRTEPYYDQPFKNIMSDGVLTSNILGEFVEELRGKDPEFIMSCLDLTKEKKIRMRNSESTSKVNGPIYRDLVYDVNIPGAKDVRVIVNLEAQLDPNPGYPLEARAAYYLGRSISDQKAEIGNQYSQLSKVYSIWFVMESPDEMSNSILRYKMTGNYDTGFEAPVAIPSCDYGEIILVYLGKLGDKGLTTVGLLNTIFAKQISREERARRINEEYKINLDESIFDEVEELMVNLDEDYKKYMARLGREEGLAAGREEGLAQGREEERAKTVSELSTAVMAVMDKMSISFDSAFEMLECSDEYREEVRARVKA